jgi:hypothetical protein
LFKVLLIIRSEETIMPKKRQKDRAENAVYNALRARELSKDTIRDILALDASGGDPRKASWYDDVEEFYAKPKGKTPFLHEDVRAALLRLASEG